MWLAIGWIGCDGSPPDDSDPPSREVGGPSVPVEITVDDETVFEGLADAPESGVYQPAADDRVCTASRRVGVFKGADVFLEVVFPGERPAAGSVVVFPSSVDVASGDWNVAGWRTEQGLQAAYGGTATLVAFEADTVEVTLEGATVCGTDRLGAPVDPDSPWQEHTTDCVAGVTVRFRTLDRLPFDPNGQIWCAAGGPGSWRTPGGDVLCSVDRVPCPVEVD